MKNVLVTGGNRGIGLEFVRQLAAAGWRVYAGTRRPSESKELQTLLSENPERIRMIRLEVRSEDDMAAVANTIGEESGVLDMLINNAATFAVDEEGLEQTRTEEMLRVLAVNGDHSPLAAGSWRVGRQGASHVGRSQFPGDVCQSGRYDGNPVTIRIASAHHKQVPAVGAQRERHDERRRRESPDCQAIRHVQ